MDLHANESGHPTAGINFVPRLVVFRSFSRANHLSWRRQTRDDEEHRRAGPSECADKTVESFRVVPGQKTVRRLYEKKINLHYFRPVTLFRLHRASCLGRSLDIPTASCRRVIYSWPSPTTSVPRAARNPPSNDSGPAVIAFWIRPYTHDTHTHTYVEPNAIS